MKKSELFRMIQHLVLGTILIEDVLPETRLEMLALLMSEESSAKTYEAYLAREAEKEAEKQ